MHCYLGKHPNSILDEPQDIHLELGNNLESKAISLEDMKPCEHYWSYLAANKHIQGKLYPST